MRAGRAKPWCDRADLYGRVRQEHGRPDERVRCAFNIVTFQPTDKHYKMKKMSPLFGMRGWEHFAPGTLRDAVARFDESDDLIALIVEVTFGGAEGAARLLCVLPLRMVSHGFRDAVNAMLDRVVRRIRVAAVEYRRVANPAPSAFVSWPTPSAAAKKARNVYRGQLCEYVDVNMVSEVFCAPVNPHNQSVGLWEHRDELYAWALGCCAVCRRPFLSYEAMMDQVDCSSGWVAPVHPRCKSSVLALGRGRVHMAGTRANALAAAATRRRRASNAAFTMTMAASRGTRILVEPVVGIPAGLSLLGAIGATPAIATRELARVAHRIEERRRRRTFRRDLHLRAVVRDAENVLSDTAIGSLGALWELEDAHCLKHVVPRRPYPSIEALPATSRWCRCVLRRLKRRVARLTRVRPARRAIPKRAANGTPPLHAVWAV